MLIQKTCHYIHDHKKMASIEFSVQYPEISRDLIAHSGVLCAPEVEHHL